MKRGIALIIMLSVLSLFGCNKDPIDDCDHANESLKEQFTFDIGVAVDPSQLTSNQAYADIVSNQFSRLTAENIFKPMFLQPAPNLFDWQDADSLVQYAERNDQSIHGHTLIWHNQLPEWIAQFEGSKPDWENLMKIHIQTIVSHFGQKVASWDVVNEAFENDGSLRNNIWLENIGESYIEQAFKYAAEADPHALLFYNDYNLAAKSKKRSAVIDFFNDLKEKNVKVDGIGLQMHIQYNYPSNSAITKAIDEIVENGYLLHISELDVSINPLGRKMKMPSSNRLAKQAEKFKFVFDSYANIPIDNQHGISIWGVSDAQSWIRSFFSRDDFPLLFDESFQAKPAYCILFSD